MSSAKIGYVPCGECNLCCRGDAVRLLPGDNLSLYKTEPHPHFHGHLMLAHKKDRDCIYLNRNVGCTIHSFRPKMCREMDCRNIYKAIPKKQALKTNGLSMNLWNKGKQLSEVDQ